MDIIIGAVIGFVLVVSAVVVGPTVKMAVGVAPYLYTNTRCSAKSGLLLKRKTYDSLLASTYVKEVYAELEETSYSHVVEHANEFGGASVLLDKDLYETYTWLEDVMPEKIRPIITAMKMKFEVQQLKEAMNALADNERPGEMQYISNPNTRLKCEEASDINSLVTALEGTPYGDLVSGSAPATELDRHYLLSVMDAIDSCKDQKAAEPFREYWRRMIDFANIRVALRRMSEDADLPFVQGGTIRVKKLQNVGDKNQLVELLQKTPYTVDVASAGIKLEQAFLQAISTEGARSSAKHPLKAGPVVNFLIQKELEVRNLNIILKLKAEGFKADEINDLLVV
ncbi:MAG: V-type ATPase subunit [Candidatus Woesearchaeota archaeon]|nr:V-type ATPase subunit [Candidatus Woesearchaeota archaeon]